MEIVKLKNINWNTQNINKAFHTSSNSETQFALRVANNIDFIYDIWDFSDKDIYHNKRNAYIYNFKDIKNEEYKIYLKRLVLRELYQRENRFTTTQVYFDIAKKFLCYLQDEKHIIKIELLHKKIINDFLEDIYNHITERTKQRVLISIKKILEEIEYENKSFKITEFDDVLNQINLQQIKGQMEFGKTPNIPKLVLNKIIQNSLSDLEDESLSIKEKMIACMILLLSQIGMRRGEIHILESDKLKEISILNDTKKSYLLDFFTYKTSTSKNGRWTETRMNEIAIKAYMTLCNITKNRRKINNKLFVNEHGNLYHINTIIKGYKNFFVRHQKQLGFDKLSGSEKKQIEEWKLNERDIKEIKALTKEDIGKIYYKVNPHQFRVAVANEFKNAGVSLQWIKSHMNHLEEEMTKHYFRDDNKIKEALFRRAKGDGSKLETSVEMIKDENIKDEFKDKEMKSSYETINSFLKKNKLNIFKDIDKIIDIFKNTPIRENEIGYCTKAMGLLCENQERLTTFENWYYVRPQVVDFNHFDFSYQRFKEKIKLIEHNRKIALENDKYKRQYELEFSSFKKFYNNKFKIEFNQFKEEIKKIGQEKFLEIHPNLKIIVKDINKIEKECLLWESKLN